MVSRKLAWSIVATALALTGCGDETADGTVFPARDFVCPAGETPPCETTEPVRSEAERTREPGMELTDATLTYVVDVLSIPEGSTTEAVGFNLDGIDSGDGSTGTTCQEYTADYVSSVHPDIRGVDNGLASLVGLLAGFIEIDEGPCVGATGAAKLDCLLGEQITSGDLLLLVQVTGVDSLRYDPTIEMQLMLGAVPDGAEIQVGGDGLLAPDQEFAIDMALGTPVVGDIFDGVLRATTPELALTIEASGRTIPLTITNPEVRFDITETGLTNGVIGGVLRLAALQDAVDMIAPDMGIDVEMIAGGLSDMLPSAGDPEVCEGLSVGIAFTATSATTN